MAKSKQWGTEIEMISKRGRVFLVSIIAAILLAGCENQERGDVTVHRGPDLKLETGVTNSGVRYFRIRSNVYHLDDIDVFALDQEESVWAVSANNPNFKPLYFVYGQRFSGANVNEVRPPLPLQKGKNYVLKVCIAGDCDSLPFMH